MFSFLETVVIGFVSGVLSGAFGVGGGLVTTPAIRLLLGAPALIAVGTPLPVILPSALVGAYSYARAGVADLRSGLIAGAAGAVFSVAGAYLATLAGGTVVLIATAALILYIAADMIVQTIRAGADASEPSDTAGTSEADGWAAPEVPEPPRARLIAIGIVTGLYSGFLGLGGGFVLVPMLTRWLRFPIKRAIATSLVAIAVLAVPGSIAHWALGNVDLRLAGALIVGVVPGAAIGARITLGASERAVRIGFATLLVLVGVALFASELRDIVR